MKDAALYCRVRMVKHFRDGGTSYEAGSYYHMGEELAARMLQEGCAELDSIPKDLKLTAKQEEAFKLRLLPPPPPMEEIIPPVEVATPMPAPVADAEKVEK